MDRLIYTSLTALRGAQARQTATANNLANVSTPGFRAEMAEAQAIWLRGPQVVGRAVTSEEVIGADMRAGTVIATGRELDISIEGNALLGVQAPNGDEAYTKRGDLQLAESGLLTTGDGHPVLGTQGPVIVHTACTFHVPLNYPGEVEVRVFGGPLGRSSIPTRYELRKLGEETLYATGEATIVWIDVSTGRSVPLPDALRTALGR